MKIIIFIILISLIITIIMQNNEKRKYEKKINAINSSIPDLNINANEITGDEFKIELLKQVKSTNINLVEIQSQLDRQNKRLKDIESSISCIVAILLVPMIISIILLFTKAKIGNDILQDVTNTSNMQTYINHYDETNSTEYK